MDVQCLEIINAAIASTGDDHEAGDARAIVQGDRVMPSSFGDNGQLIGRPPGVELLRITLSYTAPLLKTGA